MQLREARLLYRETKFIIGFDFAVTLSSPASSCVLSDIASRLDGTEMADVEHIQKMIPLITCEMSPLSICLRVGSLGVNVFDLDLGVQIDSIKQPIKRNSVGSGNMSHCRTSAFNNHLDYSFIVFKHIQ